MLIQSKNIWEIEVVVTGIAKRDRKVKRHRATIATSYDDGTDQSKPTLGGLDLQTLAKSWIAQHIKTLNKAELFAKPIAIKTYDDGSGRPYQLKELQIFNPRMFGHEVSL